MQEIYAFFSHFRMAASAEELEIPVIDISAISLIHVDVGNKNYGTIGEKLHQALGNVGFAYLANHGIPAKIVEDCMREAKTFFQLPIEEKKRFSRGDVSNPHGYSAVGREVLENNDIIEEKESFDCHSIDPRASYPDEKVPKLRGSVRFLAHQAIILARRLLRSIGEDLTPDPLKFLHAHSEIFAERNSTSLRLLHYPPIKGNELNQSCK